jgi:hypothetical protein
MKFVRHRREEKEDDIVLTRFVIHVYKIWGHVYNFIRSYTSTL